MIEPKQGEAPPLTLKAVFLASPRVKALFAEAVCFGLTNPSFDNEQEFRASYLPRIRTLVGWDAVQEQNSALQTSDAYDLVHKAILDALHCWGRWHELRKVAAGKKYDPKWVYVRFKAEFGIAPKFRVRSKSKPLGAATWP